MTWQLALNALNAALSGATAYDLKQGQTLATALSKAGSAFDAQFGRTTYRVFSGTDRSGKTISAYREIPRVPPGGEVLGPRTNAAIRVLATESGIVPTYEAFAAARGWGSFQTSLIHPPTSDSSVTLDQAIANYEADVAPYLASASIPLGAASFRDTVVIPMVSAAKDWADYLRQLPPNWLTGSTPLDPVAAGAQAASFSTVVDPNSAISQALSSALAAAQEFTDYLTGA